MNKLHFSIILDFETNQDQSEVTYIGSNMEYYNEQFTKIQPPNLKKELPSQDLLLIHAAGKFIEGVNGDNQMAIVNDIQD